MYGSLKEVQIGNFLLVGKCIQWDRTFGLTVKEPELRLWRVALFWLLASYMIRLLFKLFAKISSGQYSQKSKQYADEYIKGEYAIKTSFQQTQTVVGQSGECGKTATETNGQK